MLKRSFSLLILLVVSLNHVVQAQDAQVPKPPAEEKPLPPIDPPEYKLVCDPNPAQVLDPVKCVLSIYHVPEINVKLSADATVEQGEATLPLKQEDGRLLTTRSFVVKATDLNKALRIKNLKIIWEAVKGQKGEIPIPTYKINIKPLLTSINQPKIRDFNTPSGRVNQEVSTEQKQQFWQKHGPIPLERFNWELVIFLGAIVVILVGLLIGWILRKWKEARDREIKPFVDLRPAHIIAVEALDLLKNDEKARNQYKLYYQKLSEIIRAYMERRYGFGALEMTSDEIRSALNQEMILNQHRLYIDDFLTDTDLIKFAGLTPSEHALDQILKSAYHLVELTKQEEMPEEKAEEIVQDQGKNQKNKKKRGKK